MPRFDNVPLPVTLGLGLLTAGLVYHFLTRNRKQKTDLDSKAVVKSWLPVGQVANLEIYPIKSCHGIKVSEAESTPLGLACAGNLRDRSFMVVGENNNFLHARIHPKMVLIQPRVTGGQLKLTAPDMPDLTINIPETGDANTQVRVVRVWGEEVSALDCGDEVAAWLSRYIFKSNTGARLVYHHSTVTERVAKTKPVFPWMRATDGAAFQDLAPYHLLSQASVKDLVSQLPEGETASADNFRPCILVTGCEAYAEDKWTFIKIGNDAVFRFMKPCDRCALTTVNPVTGVKNPNLEPLRTLKKYRMATDPEVRTTVGESPFFGVNFALEQPGTIRVGDIVYAGEID